MNRHEALPEDPVWKFVAFDDYEVPKGTLSRTAQKKWRALIRFFISKTDKERSPLKAEEDLRSLPAMRLENLVPPIDWGPAATALDLAFESSAKADGPPPRVGFVVGQPFCGHAEILEKLAVRRGHAIIAPPDLETILSGSENWLEKWDASQPWVVLELERFFLRHAQGLTLVRRLLEEASRGSLGQGLVGCDSWAWAYLRKTTSLSACSALTLEAFDGWRLGAYFGQPLQSKNKSIRICSVRNGSDILSSENKISDQDEACPELKELAAHCRGNIGTAWKYWREKLCMLSEQNRDEKGEEVYWLADTQDSALFGDADEDEIFIVHALLLHNGLPLWILPVLLPGSGYHIEAILHRLQGQGVIELRDDRAHVTALGYASIRSVLRSRGYLTDDF
ncbi:MAG: hypothetical protein AB7D27_14225 [Desulfomicrobium sp.]